MTCPIKNRWGAGSTDYEVDRVPEHPTRQTYRSRSSAVLTGSSSATIHSLTPPPHSHGWFLELVQRRRYSLRFLSLPLTLSDLSLGFSLSLLFTCQGETLKIAPWGSSPSGSCCLTGRSYVRDIFKSICLARAARFRSLSTSAEIINLWVACSDKAST